VANNQTLMGEYANTRFSNLLGWLITVLMSISALALLLTFGKA
jgi:Mn2+/Fe2+ NRAMP family transporter